MKRLLFGLAFAGGFAACLAATKHFVPAEAVRGELARALGAVLSAPVSLAGQAEVSVFPTLKVRFRDAALTRADLATPIAEMRELVVRIEALPLLTGRVSVTDITLKSPTVAIEMPMTLDGLTPSRELLAGLPPVRVAVEDGRFVIDDPQQSRREVIEKIDGQFVWPRSRSGAGLEASFRWRGENVALDLQGLGPHGLAAGEVGAASLRLTSAPLRAGFQGKGVLVDRLQLDGSLSLQVSDGARLARWLGGTGLDRWLVKEAALTGRMRSLGFAATVSDARLHLDGNIAEGVVSVRLDAPRPQLRGTLAFDTVDLNPWLGRPALGDWQRFGIASLAATDVDIDLRLSAASFNAGAIDGDRFAATFLAKNGRFDLDIGEMRLWNGSVRGGLRGETSAGGIRASGRLVGSGLSAGALAAAVGFAGIDTGQVGVTLEGESAGADLGTFLSGFTGRLRAEARQIALKGAEALDPGSAPHIEPIALGTPVSGQPVAFERANLVAEIADRIAVVRQLEAVGPKLSARLSGRASLVDGFLSLVGEVDVAGRGGTGEAKRLPVPVHIGGTLRRPIPYAMSREPGADLGLPN